MIAPGAKLHAPEYQAHVPSRELHQKSKSSRLRRRRESVNALLPIKPSLPSLRRKMAESRHPMPVVFHGASVVLAAEAIRDETPHSGN
jgi:hypothetical protein